MCPLISFTEKVMCSSGSWLQCTFTGGTGGFPKQAQAPTQAPIILVAVRLLMVFHSTMRQEFCNQVKMRFPFIQRIVFLTRCIWQRMLNPKVQKRNSSLREDGVASLFASVFCSAWGEREAYCTALARTVKKEQDV